MPRNKGIVLASRPQGEAKAENFRLVEQDIGEPGEGQVLVKHHYLSLDPYMRGRMDESKSYAASQNLNEIMIGGTVGEVVASNNPNFKVGDRVVGSGGWQLYQLSDGKGLNKIDTRRVPIQAYVGPVGMPGVTAWYGVNKIIAPKKGETVVCSAATGAVGTVVGQLVKAKGARAVGIAGGPEKCAWLVDELGFDAAIDYKGEDVRRALRRHAPDGIDVYFDNVGGEILDAALANLAMHARVVICGAISQYNATEGMRGPANYMSLLITRSRMEGFVIFDYADRYAQAGAELAQWVAEGKVIAREEVVDGGIEAFGDTLLKLFAGENTGKLVLRVADE
jgi:NADPH-dependent curcumin reductase CurA